MRLAFALDQLRPCFEGRIPATIATCAADGTPNISYLSHVHLVDATHVALSHQFFNKTRANLQQNPRACVKVFDPVHPAAYRLHLRYDHEETSGPLFDAMSLRIDAIASQMGMVGIFKLLAADVFEVLAIERLPGLWPEGIERKVIETPAAGMAELCLLSQRINRAPDLDTMVASVLELMEGLFGFEHSMLLLLDESRQRLFTVASRGYPDSGVGAEVPVGEGIIGKVAQARQLLRLSTLDQELRYARVVRTRAEEDRPDDPLRREIPLPGLPDAESQLAVPLVVRDRLIGVLAVESPHPLSFGVRDEEFLTIVANHVAIALERMTADAVESEPPAARLASRLALSPRRRRFTFHRGDDCVFVDGEYLIRNIPASILWRILTDYQRDGRVDFTNRELRMDSTLRLPAIKDNLESRLILLRRRLEQKCPEVRLVRTGRGRFALEVDCPIELTEKSAA